MEKEYKELKTQFLKPTEIELGNLLISHGLQLERFDQEVQEANILCRIFWAITGKKIREKKQLEESLKTERENRRKELEVENDKILKLPEQIMKLEIYPSIEDIKKISEKIAEIKHLFLSNQKLLEQLFLENVKIDLDFEQKKAIFREKDLVIVDGRAGSGKSRVIQEKIRDLIENRDVKPEEILLIGSKSLVNEIREKVEKSKNNRENLFKYHSFTTLGSSIVKQQIENENKSDLKYTLKIISAKNFNKPFLYNCKKNNRDLYDKICDYVLKHAQKSTKSSTGFTTDEGETVKSEQELQIANYLAKKNIYYEYEEEYEYETATSTYSQYTPDFFLPGGKDLNGETVGIYLEHFGIDECGQCPQYADNPEVERKYIEGIEWKRNLHEEMGTILEETHSHHFNDGTIFDVLDDILKRYKIPEKTADTVKPFQLAFLSNFLVKYKETGEKLTIEKLQAEAMKDGNKQCIAFFEIFETYYKEYHEFLQNKSLVNETIEYIDWQDTILLGKEYVLNNNQIPKKYKYIFVDDFQHMSRIKYEFLYALKEKSSAKLFLTLDEGQSIYRYTGEEIELLKTYKKDFSSPSETEEIVLHSSYVNKELAEIASEFLEHHYTDTSYDTPKKTSPIKVVGYDSSHALNNADESNSFIRKLMSTLETLPTKKYETVKVLLLARTNDDFNFVNDSYAFTKFTKAKKGKLTIMKRTIQKGKNESADVVILINNRNEELGFPNKLSTRNEDSYLIPKENSDLDYPEERRLFYTTLTRSEGDCYLLCPEKNESSFVKELREHKKVVDVCPRCLEQNRLGLLVKKTNTLKKTTFYGCTNYKYDKTGCNYTQSIL